MLFHVEIAPVTIRDHQLKLELKPENEALKPEGFIWQKAEVRDFLYD
jgi:hypothetical protein